MLALASPPWGIGWVRLQPNQEYQRGVQLPRGEEEHSRGGANGGEGLGGRWTRAPRRRRATPCSPWNDRSCSVAGGPWRPQGPMGW